MHTHNVPGDVATFGICEGCSRPVRWDIQTEQWVDDSSLRVIVLPEREAYDMTAILPDADMQNEVKAQLKVQDNYDEYPLRNA